MITWRPLLLALAIVPAVVLAGCATGPTFSTYRPTAHSAAEGAHVSGSNKRNIWSGVGTVVCLQRVDGCRLSLWNRSPADTVLVDPGVRVLTVYGGYSGIFTDRAAENVELKATLQAGHAYQLQFERKENLMTFWVEDATTHVEVSERQSTNATVRLRLGSMAAHF